MPSSGRCDPPTRRILPPLGSLDMVAQHAEALLQYEALLDGMRLGECFPAAVFIQPGSANL
jgi:hypothetical protein